MKAISISTLAHALTYDCDRHVRLRVATREELLENDFSAYIARRELTPFQEATIRRGNIYEEKLWRRLQSVYAGNEAVSCVDLTERGTDDIATLLASVTTPTIIYQMGLVLRAESSASSAPWLRALTDASLSFGTAKPDFLFVAPNANKDALLLFVVDAKSSHSTRLSHLTQVCLYALVLTEFLAQHRIEERRRDANLLPLRVHSCAGVWRPCVDGSPPPLFDFLNADDGNAIQNGPYTFDISVVRRSLLHYLESHLPVLARKSLASADWYPDARCRTCPALNDCQRQAEGRLASLGLPRQDVRHVASIHARHSGGAAPPPSPSSVPLGDLEDIAKRLAGSNDDDHSVLRRHLDAQVAPAAAFTMIEGIRTRRLPRSEDLAIVVSLCLDPSSLTPALCAFSVHVFRGGVRADTDQNEHGGDGVANVLGDAHEYDRVARDFVLVLHSVLNRVSEHNVDVPYTHRRSAAVYVFGGAQKRALESVLLNVVFNTRESDPCLSQCAQQLALALLDTTAGAEFDTVIDTCFVTKASEAAPTPSSLKSVNVSDEFAKVANVYKDEFSGVAKYYGRSDDKWTLDGMKAVVLLDRQRDFLGMHVGVPKRDIDIAMSRFKRDCLAPLLVDLAVVVRRHVRFASPVVAELADVARALGVAVAHDDSPCDDEQVYAALVEAPSITRRAQRRAVRVLEVRADLVYALVARLRALLAATSTELTLLHGARRLCFAPPMNIKDPILCKLAFVAMHEAATACDALVNERVECTLDECAANGTILRLELLSDTFESGRKYLPDGTLEEYKIGARKGKPKVVTGERVARFRVEASCAHVRLERDKTPFKQWWLVENNDVGRRRLARMEDRPLWNALNGLSNTADIVGVERTEAGDTIVEVQLCALFSTSTGGTYWPSLGTSRHYLLAKRYVDVRKLDKIVTRIVNDDDRQRTRLIQRLLRNPFCWDAAAGHLVPHLHPQSLNAKQTAALAENRHGLAASQLAAVEHCMRRHLSLVWGPPGAGKTFFFGALILTLCRLHALSVANEQPFRILVSAATNSAIHTCLLAAAAARTALTLADDDERRMWESIMIAYATSVDGFVLPDEFLKHKPAVQVIASKSVESKTRAGVSVVGATAFQLAALLKDEPSTDWFDVILIDEASQMPVFLLPLILRHQRQRGHLIVAGDHLQLPPIINDVYPPVRGGQVKLFGSVLDALMGAESHVRLERVDTTARSAVEKFTSIPSMIMLRENFRMNTELGELCSLTYGAGYRVQHGDRRLSVRHDAAIDGKLARVLNPLRSITCVRLAFDADARRLHIGAEEAASAEARVVARIVDAFLKSASAGATKASEEILVITPHHVQRRAVREELARVDIDDATAAALCVDTVEKMQGRTADLIVCCYAYGNPTDIAAEASFLFSHSRLNVAFTRARCKLILVTSNTVHRLPLSALNALDSHDGLRLLTDVLNCGELIDW